MVNKEAAHMTMITVLLRQLDVRDIVWVLFSVKIGPGYVHRRYLSTVRVFWLSYWPVTL
jgi:hypothetical protein